MRKVNTLLIVVALLLSASLVFASGEKEAEGEGGAEKITLEFLQWWQPEMTEGSFDRVMSNFEEENPNITVEPISLPYAEVQNQVMAQGAAGQLPDVFGINPPWINTLIKQGVVEPLDDYVESSDMNVDNLANFKKIQGKYWMLPVTSYIYPLFYNIDMIEAAGLSGPPETREEFIEYARTLSNEGQNQYGWVLPLSLQLPNGVANDTFPWVWTAGGDVMQNGSPNVNNQGVVDALEFVKQMHDNNYLSPGTLTKKEQEKVEEFATGRVGMMISSIAHINILRNRNPDLNFGITAIPGPADYDGPPASRLVGWDAGIAANSDHKDAAWKLASYLVQQGPNGIIASNANAFPGNLTVTPDFVQGDELYSKAHDIFTSANLHAPLVGAPNATQLQRVFAEEMHAMLNGEQSASQAAQNAQERWEEIFAEN